MSSSSSTEPSLQMPQSDFEATTDASAGMSPLDKNSKCSFTWIISNFSKCNLKIGEPLRSPPFKSRTSEESMWMIELYPNGYKEIDNDSMTIFIRTLSTSEQGILAEYSLSLLPVDGVPLKAIVNGKATFTHKTGFGKKVFMTRPNSLDDLKKMYLPNDTLTLICDINVITDEDISRLSDEIAPMSIDDQSSLSSLSKDLLELHNAEKFCDVTLCVETGKIKAHKAILSARSPVFSTMFQNQMQENLANCVNIEDVEFETLERLVSYIYSGKAGLLTVDLAKNLFAVADKYAIGDLKKVCSRFLMSNLTVNNTMELLAFSDLYDDKQMKQTTMDYILRFKDKVAMTAEWKSILRERPHLGNELVFALITNQLENSM